MPFEPEWLRYQDMPALDPLCKLPLHLMCEPLSRKYPIDQDDWRFVQYELYFLWLTVTRRVRQH